MGLNPRLFSCKYVFIDHMVAFEDVCGCGCGCGYKGGPGKGGGQGMSVVVYEVGALLVVFINKGAPAEVGVWRSVTPLRWW